MPVIVSMHDCTVWPTSVDFVAFRCFLDGYTIEDTVGFILSTENCTTDSSAYSKGDGGNPIGERNEAAGAEDPRALAPDLLTQRQTEVQPTDDSTIPPSATAIGDTPTMPFGAEGRQTDTQDQLLSSSALVKTEDDRVCDRKDDDGDEMLPQKSTRQTPPLKHKTMIGAGSTSELTPALSSLNLSISGADAALNLAGRVQRTRHSSTAVEHQHQRRLLPDHRHHSHTGATRTSIVPAGTPPISSSSFATAGDPFTLTTTLQGAAAVRKSFSKNNSSISHDAAARRRKGSSGEYSAKDESFLFSDDFIEFQRKLAETEAMGRLSVSSTGGSGSVASLQSRLLFEEITEQFRFFHSITREEELGSPFAFLSNYYLPLIVADRLRLLEMFYEVDAGVFLLMFGNRLTHFDLVSTLNLVGGEDLAGLTNSGVLGGWGAGARDHQGLLHLGSGQSSSTIGGSVAQQWTAMWKSTPPKVASMNAATLRRLCTLHADSLRRQWDNVKTVCVSVASFYRGKGGLCVPLDMPLLTTIKQCYGFSNEVAVNYATMAFGFEHRLESRLFDRFHDFSEYGAICSVIGSLWCDRSEYFLCESLVSGCRRLARLLDESRILGELHQALFGEVMRPRWQVQLDEVQRAISTTSLGDKNSMASAAAVLMKGNGGIDSAGGPLQEGQTGGAGNGSRGAGSPAGVAMPIFNVQGGSGMAGNVTNSSPTGGNIAGAANGGGMTGSPASAGAPAIMAQGHGSGVASGDNNSSTHNSVFSGNRKFSRRFLLEFHSLMKHIVRLFIAIGSNRSINDALDVFFLRVYTYLESLSSRSAPAVVSLVMNSAANNTPTAPGLNPSLPRVTSSGSLNGPAGALTQRCRSMTELHHAAHPSSIPSSAVVARREGKAEELADYDLGQRYGSRSAPPAPCSSRAPESEDSYDRRRTVTENPCVTAASSAPSFLSPTSCTAASTVVNTSMVHPAATLLPLTAALAAHGGSAASPSSAPSSPFVTVPVYGRSFASQEELDCSEPVGSRGKRGTTAAPMAATGASTLDETRAFDRVDSSVLPHTPGGNGHAGLLSTEVSQIVLKAIDKCYLRELCMLLTAMPSCWQELSSLTPEDHATCDSAFTNVFMALKAITQILMASEDFH